MNYSVSRYLQSMQEARHSNPHLSQKTPAAWLASLLLVMAISLLPVGKSEAANAGECGDLQNAYGPFDYYDKSVTEDQPGLGASPLNLVESGHFNADVENLVRGISTASPLPDIEYTLRAFPNHPRALYAMARFYLRQGLGRKYGIFTIDCWFERASRFKPDDAMVYLVYGIFLSKKGDSNAAISQYQKALQIVPNNAEAHYNIGLLYTKLKNYKLANQHAVEAYQLGFPLPGLRDRLKKLGVWDESVSQ